jgi:hypothetical protein
MEEEMDVTEVQKAWNLIINNCKQKSCEKCDIRERCNKMPIVPSDWDKI